MTDELYLKRARAWMAMQVEIGKPPGVMLRASDIERWSAWHRYFEAQGCKDELRGMRLCEHDQWPSREPGTNQCWRMFPTDYPQEFDPQGAADARA